MIDKTPLECQALAATLRPLAEIAAEIGPQKPIYNYSREEALALAEAIIDAYQHCLLEHSLKQPNPQEERKPAYANNA